MNCELNPLSWAEFEEFHRNAWNAGSTFGPAFTELYLDYLKNFQFFMNYLDELTEGICKEKTKKIKILIGEAPPIWKGIDDPKERSYYYNPYHSKSTPWLTEPIKYFLRLIEPKKWEIKKDGKIYFDNKLASKKDELTFLATNGVVLIDIFPFPVLQNTNIRKRINTKKKQSSFSIHVEKYFIEHLNKVLEFINCKLEYPDEINFEFAFMAPEFTSLQLMYDPHIVNNLIKLKLTPLIVMTGKSLINVQKISEIVFKTGLNKGELPNPKSNSKSKFLSKLTKKEIIETTDLENIPILMNGITPEFVNFFNSSEEKLKEKFGI